MRADTRSAESGSRIRVDACRCVCSVGNPSPRFHTFTLPRSHALALSRSHALTLSRSPSVCSVVRQRVEVGSQTSEVEIRMRLNSAKDLEVYQVAYRLAMLVFRLSLGFPAEEKFALTSQIRRSSRSICLNLREAWAKRRYEAHFISKLTDCDGENSETDSSLDFARDCGYITSAEHAEAVDCCAQVGRMLGAMIASPESFLVRDR